ncbi:hypothetical protein PROFUN_03159 [Planoprotostelium fungivorum]|uniref:Mitotic-spindle organizing protein 1 n=1 Tax=Planoprotostelium fungivorum TaxID=1890364 RepID=A0A2P6NWV3_9EUKA|nr:hypothetical protein PROFUN_03159 [Planoprotostelium fungivorum]
MSSREDARQILQAVKEVSDSLNTGLEYEELSILTQLCEMGVNPEALGNIMLELKKEKANLTNRS